MNEDDFRSHCYGIFLKVLCRKHLIKVMFKVLYQLLRGTLTTTFERHLTNEDFTDIGVKPSLSLKQA